MSRGYGPWTAPRWTESARRGKGMSLKTPRMFTDAPSPNGEDSDELHPGPAEDSTAHLRPPGEAAHTRTGITAPPSSDS
jgi:hypothetical protein